MRNRWEHYDDLRCHKQHQDDNDNGQHHHHNKHYQTNTTAAIAIIIITITCVQVKLIQVIFAVSRIETVEEHLKKASKEAAAASTAYSSQPQSLVSLDRCERPLEGWI